MNPILCLIQYTDFRIRKIEIITSLDSSLNVKWTIYIFLSKLYHKVCEVYLREAQSRIFWDMHSKYFPRGILQTVRKASEYMLIKLSHLQIFYILRNKLLITNLFNKYILHISLCLVVLSMFIKNARFVIFWHPKKFL